MLLIVPKFVNNVMVKYIYLPTYLNCLLFPRKGFLFQVINLLNFPVNCNQFNCDQINFYITIKMVM